jgi:hypothetical protein
MKIPDNDDEDDNEDDEGDNEFDCFVPDESLLCSIYSLKIFSKK